MKHWLSLAVAILLFVLTPLPTTAEGINTIELPPSTTQVPLPEGWTKREFVDRFIWLWATTPGGLFKNQWMGIPTRQNPFDVWVTQEILYEVKPDLVVECGTFKGGSSIMWAMILEEINPGGRVITIDIADKRTPRAKRGIAKHKIEFMLGSSTDPKIVAEVTRRAKGKRVLVILDSAHTAEHVLGELHAYSGLVDIGSYVVVQDSVINGHPLPGNTGPGPWEAVHEFMQDNAEFAIDRTRERLLVTANTDGFLKRIAAPETKMEDPKPR
jgi:cephalosporin hydroxylase